MSSEMKGLYPRATRLNCILIAFVDKYSYRPRLSVDKVARTESPRITDIVAFEIGLCEIPSFTNPITPCAEREWEKKQNRNEQAKNRESLLEEGFLRIITCWFFDRNISIEKSELIRTKDNGIIRTITEINVS